MGRRSDIDWAAIRIDFEANLLTGDELAAKHGVDRASIYRKARKNGWVQNHAAEVAQRTQAMLVHATAGTSPNPTATTTEKPQSDRKATKQQGKAATGVQEPGPTGQDTTTPADPVGVAASANVQIILTHRRHLSKAQELTARLWAEAEQQFNDTADVLPLLKDAQLVDKDGKPLGTNALRQVAAALARARDLPARAATIKTLTECMRGQQLLERMAFGIDKGDGGAGQDDGDFRTRMLNARERALSSRRP